MLQYVDKFWQRLDWLLGGILLSFWHVVMVLNNFLMMTLSGLFSGLDDFLAVSWECLMHNGGRSLLRAEWSNTAKKLNSGLFGTLFVQIRESGTGAWESSILCATSISIVFVHRRALNKMNCPFTY